MPYLCSQGIFNEDDLSKNCFLNIEKTKKPSQILCFCAVIYHSSFAMNLILAKEQNLLLKRAFKNLINFQIFMANHCKEQKVYPGKSCAFCTDLLLFLRQKVLPANFDYCTCGNAFRAI